MKDLTQFEAEIGAATVTVQHQHIGCDFLQLLTKMDGQTVAVGIIGMGDMGKMYARRIGDAGWR